MIGVEQLASPTPRIGVVLTGGGARAAYQVGVLRAAAQIRRGHLDAFAVSASSYTSGMHVTFYDAKGDVPPWTRSQRVAVRCRVGVRHLLASSAIPFLFPAAEIELGAGIEWFGDGSMRQS